MTSLNKQFQMTDMSFYKLFQSNPIWQVCGTSQHSVWCGPTSQPQRVTDAALLYCRWTTVLFTTQNTAWACTPRISIQHSTAQHSIRDCLLQPTRLAISISSILNSVYCPGIPHIYWYDTAWPDSAIKQTFFSKCETVYTPHCWNRQYW